ncbi:hypothetical protein C7293_04845 [filamentous cyanobacterium CCT1]|nr:hypothetical protein C7293_04845 [filamentous cyanobacterium CCT1]PSN79012.1 hypothetical protein C8B47_13950 [filamentous cyanobacterium CCP4]
MARIRGVVLTDSGKARFDRACMSLVTSRKISRFNGPRLSVYSRDQKLFVSATTINQVLKNQPVERTSLQCLFTLVELSLEKGDYIYAEKESPVSNKASSEDSRSSDNILHFGATSLASRRMSRLNQPEFTERQVSDWMIQQYLTRWETAPNGLQYRIAKLQHEFQERIDRGKCYELELLNTDERERIESQIRRHDRTLSTLAKIPGIPENRTVLETGGRWWIIDEWIEGETLTAALKRGPFPTKALPDFARSLTTIIQALHKVDVIQRDLSPGAITIRATDGQPFVTDFEMAKLMSRKSTVSSGDWERSPFLAPEIVEGEETSNPKVDFYSWAMVVIAAGMGELKPTPELAAQWISSAQLPRPVSKILSSCIHPSWRGRPHSARDILQALARW